MAKPKPMTRVSLARLGLLLAPLILAVFAIKLASAAHAQGLDAACLAPAFTAYARPL